MSKKSTELAKSEPASLAFSADFDDLFGDLPDDQIVTGVEDSEMAPFRFRLKVMNFRGQAKNGRACPVDAIFDTQDELPQEKLHARLLVVRDSREWRTYSEKEKRGTTHCRSYDLKLGVMADGRTRPCGESCPDYQWVTTEDGKRSKNCADVRNVVGLETDGPDASPVIDPDKLFMIRFKKVTLKPWQKFRAARIDRKRKILRGGKMFLANLPLYTQAVTISMKPDNGGNYALPEIEVGPYLDKSLIGSFNELAETIQTLQSEIERAAEQDHESDTDTADRPNPNDFRDDAYHDDVVDAELVDDAPTSGASSSSGGKQAALGADF